MTDFLSFATAHAKQCTKCGLKKSLSAFGKRPERSIKIGSPGLRSNCKDCMRLSSRKWYSLNREKANDESRGWRAKNLDKAKESNANWYAANLEYSKVKSHNRRVIGRDSGQKLSKGLASKLFKLQQGKCPCCKQPLGNDFHMDHKVPLALGGANVDSNIQLLRQRCNMQKHAKDPVDFMQSRGFLL